MSTEELSEAQWSYWVLRGLISYHQRTIGPDAPCVLNADRTPVCEKQLDCKVYDGFLNALRFALSCVEEKL